MRLVAAMTMLVGLAAPAYAGGRECDNRILRGPYAVQARGFFDPAIFDPTQDPELPLVTGESLPATAINLSEFDGDGGFTTSWSIDVDGGVISTDNVSIGTYQVLDDCTGVLHLTVFPDPGQPEIGIQFDVPIVVHRRGDWFLFHFLVPGANLMGRADRL